MGETSDDKTNELNRNNQNFWKQTMQQLCTTKQRARGHPSWAAAPLAWAPALPRALPAQPFDHGQVCTLHVTYFHTYP